MDKNIEIERNLTYFISQLPELSAQLNRFALIRHQEIIGFFDTPKDAIAAGNMQYSDGLFSIQQVTSEASNLGYYSYALHLGNAQQIATIS